jgi:pimeloyl-ACP methyl ester carboxylesterase
LARAGIRRGAADPRAHRHELLVADILAVLDDLGVEQAHFLGYSMGGRIGFAIAKYAPDRFSSVIIGGANPYAGSREGLEARVAMLRKGPEGVVAIWDSPVSPAHRARLLANDTEARASRSVSSTCRT